MKRGIGKKVFLLSSALCLLLAGKTSFALTNQDINDIQAACSKQGCGMTCTTIIGTLVCYCSGCKAEATSFVGGDLEMEDPIIPGGMLYQVGDDQYFCANQIDGRMQCSPIRYQVKTLDLQNLPTMGVDKAAADEILRLRGRGLMSPQVEVTGPTEVTAPIQKPTRSIFQRTTPLLR